MTGITRLRVLQFLSVVALCGAILWPVITNDQVAVGLYTIAALWALWAWSLNVVWGFGGQLSLAPLALGAVAAYSMTILLVEYGVPAALGAVAGLALSAGLGAMIALAALHVASFRLAIMTLAFALAILGVISNVGMAGRTTGLGVPTALPTFAVGGWTIDLSAPGSGFYLVLALLVAAITLSMGGFLRTAPGRSLLAIREDELLAMSLGIEPRKYRVVAFSLSGLIAGMAGIAHALTYNYISPGAFSFHTVVTLILILVLGGRGTLMGPVVGAGIYVLFFQGLRLGGEFESALFGVIVIAITLLAPRGVAPHFGSAVRFLRTRGVSPSRRPSPTAPPAMSATANPAANGRAPNAIPRPQNPQTAVDSILPDVPVLLRAEHLSKSFGGVTATDDVTIEVHRGDILGVIGPNGAGKTTLFNQLSGFLSPDRGDIWWKGDTCLNGVRPAERVSIGLARTFQHSRVFPSLTVRTNLRIAAQARKDEQPDRIVDDILARFGLAEVAEEMASELSYGTVKRVSLALVVAAGCDLLLLDEPAAGLAEGDIDILRNDLLALSGAGVTLLVVEHHMSLIMQVCNRIVVLDTGAVIAEGTPQEISSDPAVIDAYLGAGA